MVFIARVQVRIVEELAFITGSSLFPRMVSAFNVTEEDAKPNELIVKGIVRRLGGLGSARVNLLCHALCRDAGVDSLKNGEHIIDAFVRAVDALISFLLSQHLDLLYDRHLTAIVVGGIYCTVRGSSLCFVMTFPNIEFHRLFLGKNVVCIMSLSRFR